VENTMRWTVQMVEAIVQLRAISLSGDFDHCSQFHIEQDRHMLPTKRIELVVQHKLPCYSFSTAMSQPSAATYPQGVFNAAFEFEPGWVEFKNLTGARHDAFWLEQNILECGLSKNTPWTFTMLYSDGSVLPIRLDLMSSKPLNGNPLTVFRRHSKSKRIIPFQLKPDDPILSLPENARLPWQEVLLKAASPRFDPVVTPLLTRYVETETAIMMGTGMAEVAELQAITLVVLDIGWQITRPPVVRPVARVLKPGLLVLDEDAIAAKLLDEVNKLGGPPFLRFLECARRVGEMAKLTLQSRVSILTKICDMIGYEYSVVDKGSRILLIAKDAKAGLEVTAQGVQLGRVSLTPFDLVNCSPIRPFGG
jgi:hypothetical protein